MNSDRLLLDVDEFDFRLDHKIFGDHQKETNKLINSRSKTLTFKDLHSNNIYST